MKKRLEKMLTEQRTQSDIPDCGSVDSCYHEGSRSFLEFENVERIINDTAILTMVAAGQLLVILTGGIDLSVGSTIAFSGMAASMLNQYNPAMPVSLVLLIGILIGTALGAFNGVCVAYGKIPPIITTLGTMSIFRGFTFVLSKGQWVTAHEMTEAYMNIPKGRAAADPEPDGLGSPGIYPYVLLYPLYPSRP